MSEPNQIWLKAGSHPDDVPSLPPFHRLLGEPWLWGTDDGSGVAEGSARMRPGRRRRFMHVDVCGDPIQTCDRHRSNHPHTHTILSRHRKRGNAGLATPIWWAALAMPEMVLGGREHCAHAPTTRALAIHQTQMHRRSS